jgi:hypothetical protein
MKRRFILRCKIKSLLSGGTTMGYQIANGKVEQTLVALENVLGKEGVYEELVRSLSTQELVENLDFIARSNGIDLLLDI